MKIKAIILSLCAAVYLLAPTAVSAAQCKAKLTSQGAWTIYPAAESSARVKWRRAARRLHGRKYRSWLNAKNRSYKCQVKGLRKRCKASANPCS